MVLSDRDYEWCVLLGGLMARIIIENCLLLACYRTQREAGGEVGVVRWRLPSYYVGQGQPTGG